MKIILSLTYAYGVKTPAVHALQCPPTSVSSQGSNCTRTNGYLAKRQGEREDTGEALNSNSEGATGVGLGANALQVTAHDHTCPCTFRSVCLSNQLAASAPVSPESGPSFTAQLCRAGLTGASYSIRAN